MGDVYRARDTRLNLQVAIKLLANSIADPLAIPRFQQEALTASSLNHPHILTVFESGEIDGKQYLVAALVDGGTLNEWVHHETRTWKQIVDMLVGVADGTSCWLDGGRLQARPISKCCSRSYFGSISRYPR